MCFGKKNKEAIAECVATPALDLLLAKAFAQSLPDTPFNRGAIALIDEQIAEFNETPPEPPKGRETNGSEGFKVPIL